MLETHLLLQEVDDSLDQLEDEDLEERFEFDTRFNPVVAAPAVTEEQSAEARKFLKSITFFLQLS